jgi:hypothetical protein
MPSELNLPTAKRLPEFTDGALKATRERLLNPAPVRLDLEEARLAAGLQEALDLLGAEHPAVKALLVGRTPQAAAHAALAGTRMADPAARAQYLAEPGAMEKDSLVAFARILDPFSRAAQQRLQEEVQSVLDEHAGRIANARFKAYGTSLYPDATFTLRLT